MAKGKRRSRRRRERRGGGRGADGKSAARRGRGNPAGYFCPEALLARRTHSARECIINRVKLVADAGSPSPPPLPSPPLPLRWPLMGKVRGAGSRCTTDSAG